MARLALRLMVVVAWAQLFELFGSASPVVACTHAVLVTGPPGAVDDTVAVTVRLAVWPGRRVPISQVMTPPPWVHPEGVVAVRLAGTESVTSALPTEEGPVLVTVMV